MNYSSPHLNSLRIQMAKMVVGSHESATRPYDADANRKPGIYGTHSLAHLGA